MGNDLEVWWPFKALCWILWLLMMRCCMSVSALPEKTEELVPRE